MIIEVSWIGHPKGDKSLQVRVTNIADFVPFIPCGAADERHVVVGAEAVDGLVERLIPAAHEGTAARVEEARRGVVPEILGIANQESLEELIP